MTQDTKENPFDTLGRYSADRLRRKCNLEEISKKKHVLQNQMAAAVEEERKLLEELIVIESNIRKLSKELI